MAAATKAVTSILPIRPSPSTQSFSSSSSNSILLWKTTLGPLPEASLERAGMLMSTTRISLLEENVILHTPLPGSPGK